MRRLLKLIALGGAGYALWRLLTAGGPEPAGPAAAEAPVPPAPAGIRPAEWVTSGGKRFTVMPARKGRSSEGIVPAPAPTSKADEGARAPTKAELYERAKQLGIEGRSKLSKSELERAIREAG